MTLALYPALSMVGLAVSRRVAPTIRAMPPSLAIAPSRSGESGSNVVAGLLAHRGEELLDRFGQHQRELVAAQPGDRLGDGGDGVVVVHHRAVSGAAACAVSRIQAMPFSAVSMR